MVLKSGLYFCCVSLLHLSDPGPGNHLPPDFSRLSLVCVSPVRFSPSPSLSTPCLLSVLLPTQVSPPLFLGRSFLAVSGKRGRAPAGVGVVRVLCLPRLEACLFWESAWV